MKKYLEEKGFEYKDYGTLIPAAGLLVLRLRVVELLLGDGTFLKQGCEAVIVLFGVVHTLAGFINTC